MNKNALGGILVVGAMLTLGWQTSMAAEAGKTAAADLSRDANASLQQLTRAFRWPSRSDRRRVPFLSFPRSPRPAWASAVNTAKARCSRRARQSRITTPRGHRSGYRPVPSNTATPCSS